MVFIHVVTVAFTDPVHLIGLQKSTLQKVLITINW